MRLSTVLGVLLLSVLSPAESSVIDAAEAPAPLGYDALLRIDQLPLLTDWPAFQDSSYSRKDDNSDEGNFLRVEPDGEQVLVDTDGPGVVYRIWSTGVVGRQMSDQCRLRFHFDNDEKPRLDLSIPELFGAEGSKYPFVPPLSVTFESGAAGNPGEGPANLCYVPIPFEKHLKISGRNIAFYHVDYLKVKPPAAVASWTADWAESQREKHQKAAALFDNAGRDPKPPVNRSTTQSTAGELVPQEKLSIEIAGPATIDAVRVKLAEPTPRALRGLRLQITFDAAEGPSVLVPLGDFFGSGCGDRRFKSLACGMTDDGYYAYWPMPFKRRAVLEIVNDLAQPVEVKQFEVDSHPTPELPANSGYFHARYVQNPDCADRQDYTILAVDGHRGKYVGTNITMQNARGGTGIFFLEGDEKIYCDGEKWPSRWLGTGTEDYYNGAYFWNHPDKANMARPLGGLTFLSWEIGRVCAYRWHIPDCISFERSIRVDQEHGGVSDVPANYQSVAYYYLDDPTAQPPLPPVAERLPVTPLPPAPAWLCCELQGDLVLGDRPLAKRTFHEADPEFDSGGDVQYFAEPKVGQSVEGTIALPGEDRFAPAVFLSGGPTYGIADILLDGNKLATADCYRREFTPWVAVMADAVRLNGGPHKLQIKLTGKNQAAAAAQLGIVALQLHPTSKMIDAWSIVGTWPCPKEGGWAKVNPPETDQSLQASYAGPNGAKLAWKPAEGDHVGFGGDWTACYGLTYVWSPDERTAGCFIGKDDSLKLWCNDEVAFDVWGWSHLVPDSFHCTVRLKPGWNKLLVKSANWYGGAGFCLRLGDPEQELKFARQPEKKN